MARFLIAIVLILLTQSVPRDTLAQGRSTNYYLTGGSETSVDFVDVESIKVVGNIRTYWETSHRAKPSEEGLYFSRSFVSADCVNETTTNLYVVYYNILGNVISSGEAVQTKRRVIPETVGDVTFQFVCASPAERLKMGALKVDNVFEAAAIWFASIQ